MKCTVNIFNSNLDDLKQKFYFPLLMCQRQRFWRLYYIVLRSLLNSSHEYFASIIYLDSLWIFWQFYGDDIILTTSYRVHFFDFYHFCVFLYVFIWPKMNSKILTMHIWLLYFNKNYFNIYFFFFSPYIVVPCLWSRCIFLLFDEVHSAAILWLLHSYHGLLGDSFSHGWASRSSQIFITYGWSCGCGLGYRIWSYGCLHISGACSYWNIHIDFFLGK